MQHVDDCPRCAIVWAQMQGAQSAVLGLEELRVGGGFRDKVWARIQAGEGASELSLHPQVSIAAKCRYGLVGAFAAAVVLALFHWSTRGGQATGTADSQVARNEPNGEPPAGIERPDTSAPVIRIDPGRVGRVEQRVEGVPPREGSPAALAFVPSFGEGGGPPAVFEAANQAASQVRSASRRLTLQASLLDRAPEQVPAERWVSVHNDLQQIENGLDLLSRMERAGVLDLRGSARECFVVAQRTLRVQQPQEPKELQGAVRLLTSCPLDDISDAISFPSRALGDSQWLLRLIETYPNYRDAAEAFENTLRFRVVLRNQDGSLLWMPEQRAGGTLRIRSYKAPPGVESENRQDGG